MDLYEETWDRDSSDNVFRTGSLTVRVVIGDKDGIVTTV